MMFCKVFHFILQFKTSGSDPFKTWIINIEEIGLVKKQTEVLAVQRISNLNPLQTLKIVKASSSMSLSQNCQIIPSELQGKFNCSISANKIFLLGFFCFVFQSLFFFIQ